MADPACPLPATPPFSVEPLIALDVEKVPFVVGVTGHRDLNPGDLVSLQAAVEKLLREIKDRHESATIVLLSPLAEGADRIAAKAAYALGIPVVVPMPMPQDEYEHDFPKSVKEFRDLVHGAYHSFELPLVEGNTRANIGYKAHGYKPHRDRQYQALGQYIARHCQELIALWDGIPADGGGGSEAAAIVQYERDGVEQAELIAIWDKIPADDDGGAGTAAVVKYKLEGIERRLHFECDLVLRPASSESSLLDSSECGPVGRAAADASSAKGSRPNAGIGFLSRDPGPARKSTTKTFSRSSVGSTRNRNHLTTKKNTSGFPRNSATRLRLTRLTSGSGSLSPTLLQSITTGSCIKIGCGSTAGCSWVLYSSQRSPTCRRFSQASSPTPNSYTGSESCY